MVGSVFVNISLHHSLACWRKIGRIDTNKGTLGIYWITSKNSHFTHQVLSDNLLGRLPIFGPNIKTNCQKIILSFRAAFHFFSEEHTFCMGHSDFFCWRQSCQFSDSVLVFCLWEHWPAPCAIVILPFMLSHV